MVGLPGVPQAPKGLMGAAQQSFDDLKKKYLGMDMPEAAIFINGAYIGEKSSHNYMVNNVTVELTCGYEASAAHFRVYNVYDLNAAIIDYTEVAKQLDLGVKVDILLGYMGVTENVFTGFIAGLNIIYEEELPYVEVTALDIKGAMMANNYAMQLKGASYSACVREILEKPAYGEFTGNLNVEETPDSPTMSLGAGATPKTSTLEMVEESDYEFIVKAAKKYGYEFFVSQNTVIFRKPKSQKVPMFTLAFGQGVITLDIGYSLNGLVKSIEARSSDVGKGKAFVAKARISGEYGVSNAANKLLKESRKVYIDPTIDSKETASQRADALVESISYRFGTLACECVGIPDLVPGRFVKLNLVKGQENLQFYVTEVKHKLDSDKGFRTELTAKANTIKPRDLAEGLGALGGLAGF